MKLFYGREEFFLDMQKKKLKEQYDCMETSYLDESSNMFINSASFFDKREKAVLFIPDDVKSLKRVDEEWLQKNNVFAFYYGDLKLDIECETKEFKKLTENQLCSLINKKLPHLSRELMLEIISGVDYFGDGNLYMLVSEINKLSLLDNVNEQLVEELIGKNSFKYDAFMEAKYIVNGEVEKAVANASACPVGQEMLFLGALKRFFRAGWKYNYFNAKEVGYAQKTNPKFSVDAIKILDAASDSIIAGRLPAKVAILNAVLKLGGKVNGNLHVRC